MSFTHTKTTYIISVTGIFTILLTTPTIAFGEQIYNPFVELPGFNYDTLDFTNLVNTLYLMLIGVGALYGVLKIAYAGIKYTTSDVVTDKQDALHDIRGVFIGLAILLIPTLILKTINSDLLNLNVLSKFGDAVQTDVRRVGASGTWENTPSAGAIGIGSICTERTGSCATECGSKGGYLTTTLVDRIQVFTCTQSTNPTATGTIQR